MRRSTALTAIVAMLASLLLLGAAPPQHAGTELTRVIVTFDDDVAPGRATARDVVAAHRGELFFVYEHVLHGFAADVPAGRLAALQRDPRVASVEESQEVRIASSIATGTSRIGATANPDIPTGQDGDATGDVDADIAILDTGIAQLPTLNVMASVDCTQHSGGRPNLRTYTCQDDFSLGGNDGNGHGTHVAGTAAGQVSADGVIGVAPGARLHAVKVLDDRGSGTTDGVIAGIDWVAERAGTIKVANMSLGGGASEAMDTAVRNAVQAGVVFAIAAGNSNTDASTSSPARVAEALTVAALADSDGDVGGFGGTTFSCRTGETDDTLASFSNSGDAIDLAAPGVCIRSLWFDGTYREISGTSMAAPHVAGAAALLASQVDGPTPSRGLTDDAFAPGSIEATILDKADSSWVEPEPYGILNVSEAAAFSPVLVGDGSDDPGTTDPEQPAPQDPPLASFNVACQDLSCVFTNTSTDDGTATYEWAFGDGATSTATNPTHVYGAAQTYNVTLTVSGTGGTGTASQDVSVREAADDSTTITLQAQGYKVQGRHTIDLTWQGASGDFDIKIYRDGSLIKTVQSTASTFTDRTGNRGGGSYTYQVCEASTTEVCSNGVTITF